MNINKTTLNVLTKFAGATLVNDLAETLNSIEANGGSEALTLSRALEEHKTKLNNIPNYIQRAVDLSDEDLIYKVKNSALYRDPYAVHYMIPKLKRQNRSNVANKIAQISHDGFLNANRFDKDDYIDSTILHTIHSGNQRAFQSAINNKDLASTHLLQRLREWGLMKYNTPVLNNLVSNANERGTLTPVTGILGDVHNEVVTAMKHMIDTGNHGDAINIVDNLMQNKVLQSSSRKEQFFRNLFSSPQINFWEHDNPDVIQSFLDLHQRHGLDMNAFHRQMGLESLRRRAARNATFIRDTKQARVWRNLEQNVASMLPRREAFEQPHVRNTYDYKENVDSDNDSTNNSNTPQSNDLPESVYRTRRAIAGGIIGAGLIGGGLWLANRLRRNRALARDAYIFEQAHPISSAVVNDIPLTAHSDLSLNNTPNIESDLPLITENESLHDTIKNNPLLSGLSIAAPVTTGGLTSGFYIGRHSANKDKKKKNQ